MATKPIKFLELHYTMTQFLIIRISKSGKSNFFLGGGRGRFAVGVGGREAFKKMFTGANEKKERRGRKIKKKKFATLCTILYLLL